MAILMVETLDGHGRVLQRDRFEMEGRAPVVVGRGLEADVVVDDPHVAARHASLALDAAGRVQVTDLGSLNGVIVDGRRHKDARDLPLTRGTLQVGRTRLRLRSGTEPLPAERPDTGTPAFAGRSAALAGIAACTGIALYNVWLEAPPDFAPAAAIALIGGAAVSAVWVAAWALLSRILGGEWRWPAHAAIFFGVVASVFVVGLALDVAGFAWALPRAPWVAWVLYGAGVAAALFLHITQASSLRRRTAALCAILLPAAVGGTAHWASARSQAGDVDHIADDFSLYPPALRVRAAAPLENFFAEAASLQEEADAGRRRIEAEDDAEQ